MFTVLVDGRPIDGTSWVPDGPGLARVAVVAKPHALHHPARGDVEAGDDPLGEPHG